MAHELRNLLRGTLSKETGVNMETIRYYEKAGLMPEPARSDNGYRIYNESHIKRLAFVKRCRELGFSLKEVAALLRLVDGGDYTCAEIRDHTVSHLRDVEEKIRDLRKMQRTLKNMVSECDGLLMPECPIVDSLYSS
jgi:MerR family mercuric resistance operon transcriptional regulator